MNDIIYDILAAAVLIFFAWLGYRKGLVLTLCSLLAVFVALVGAAFLSDALAEPVAKAIEPVVAGRIHDALTETIQHSATEQSASELLTDIPLDQALDALKESGRFQGFVRAFEEAVDEGIADATANAARALAHFVAVQIARTVLFVAAFFGVLLAWWFLSHALDLVAKLPVLNSVNRWGGGAAGLVKGLLVVLIALWLFQDSYIPPETVEHTVLLKFLANLLSFFL